MNVFKATQIIKADHNIARWELNSRKGEEIVERGGRRGRRKKEAWPSEKESVGRRGKMKRGKERGGGEGGMRKGRGRGDRDTEKLRIRQTQSCESGNLKMVLNSLWVRKEAMMKSMNTVNTVHLI